MKRLEFHISYICSHKCIFCSEDDRMKKFKNFPLSLLQIKAILIDRKKKGFNHVNFTGGEPTILKGFLDLLKFTKKLGYKIYVGTNGTMFYNDEFAKIALQYIDELSLSVHWYSKDTCYKQTGIPNHYDNFLKIVENIEKYKTNNFFFLNVVLNKYNYLEAEKIISFVIDTGYSFKQVLVSNIAPEGKALHSYKELSFDLNEFKKYIPDIIKKCINQNKIVRFFGFPSCILGDEFEDYSNDKHWEKRNTIERFSDKAGSVKLIDICSLDNSRERKFVEKCNSCKWEKNPCSGVFRKYLDYYSF